MREELACSILKIIGVVTVLIGVVLCVQSALAWLTLPDASTTSALGTYIAIEGVVGDVARAAIMSNAIVVFCGFLLCASSPALARYVAGYTPSNRALDPANQSQSNREG